MGSTPATYCIPKLNFYSSTLVINMPIVNISAIVGEFQVKFGSAASGVDLRINNTQLLDCAARTGENQTAAITRESQLVIAQDRVYLFLDCSSLLPSSCEPQCPEVVWTRRLQPGECDIG